jgi:hypothetical protein
VCIYIVRFVVDKMLCWGEVYKSERDVVTTRAGSRKLEWCTNEVRGGELALAQGPTLGAVLVRSREDGSRPAVQPSTCHHSALCTLQIAAIHHTLCAQSTSGLLLQHVNWLCVMIK